MQSKEDAKRNIETLKAQFQSDMKDTHESNIILKQENAQLTMQVQMMREDIQWWRESSKKA